MQMSTIALFVPSFIGLCYKHEYSCSTDLSVSSAISKNSTQEIAKESLIYTGTGYLLGFLIL